MTPGIRPLIAGNWKMNTLVREAVDLAKAVVAGAGSVKAELLVCPPFPYIAGLAGMLAGSTVAVGAQDCHAKEKGAHTGDVAAAMLKDCGASYVILGHSERRADQGETSHDAWAKAAAAHRHGGAQAGDPSGVEA